MIHTGWNMSSDNPASVDVRAVCVLVFFTLALLVFQPSRGAAEKPVTSLSNASAADVEIEARVRRTLRQDAQLGPLNLGVHIVGGAAKLSGPVPTAELRQRAVQIVQRVDGVLTVTDKDLYVSSSARGRKRVSIRIQDDGPTQTRAASPLSPSTAQAAPAGAGRQITLLAPEMAAPAATAPEAARLTANPRPVSPSIAIAAAIEQLRRSDARYQQIRARVSGTTVYIMPGETATEDAMTFAQTVRRLSSVQHVIMDSSR
jgi:hypothetical protein